MGIFVLDTDHITLLQRGNESIVQRFGEIPEEEIATSIITYEEQLRGRLSIIRRARTPARLAEAYKRLREMQEFFCVIRIVDFDERAATIFRNLRREHGAMGTMDLRIAASTLSAKGTLVTRNTSDFERIVGLPLADWSARPDAPNR
jgi:tRNA(fMet)-specific endonuclease VapC